MDRKKKQEKHSGFRQMIMFVLHNMTIKHKLISIIMATCIVALLLAGTVFILWEWSTLRQTMARNLSTQAEMIADNCKAAVAFEDAMDAKKTLGALKAETSIVFGGVYGKDGKLFAGYYKDNIGAGVKPSELQKDRYSFGEGFLTVFKPIVLDAETIGTVCLRSDLQPMYAMLKRNIKVIISLLFLASMAAYFVSSRLQRVISGPILSLAESAITIGKGELDHRVNIQSGDEIGHLASSFNEMTENLRKSTTSIDNLNREITERKQAEEALRKSEERFKQVAESAGDWIWEVNDEGLYTYSSPISEKILGYRPEEIVGKRYFYDFFAPKVKEELRKAALETFAKGESFTGLINPNVHKNGSIVILETNGTPIIDDKGNLCGYRGVDRDITERKKAEERQAELIKEVESSNRELNDLVYIMSHDLKTPLRGINTLADWLSTDYADKFDQEGKQRVNLLLRRVDRMYRLIDGILKYSEVGRLGEEIAPVNLDELVPNIISMIAIPGNITITVENELPVIECEKTQITKIFQNLLSNAVKYIDKPQGQIRIECVEEDGFWKFSVADNGTGIDEKYFEKIFQIFQTLSPWDEVGSTGVGLTIVKKIVEMHGGRIWVESKVGQGSTFFFTLPMHEIAIEEEKIPVDASGCV